MSPGKHPPFGATDRWIRGLARHALSLALWPWNAFSAELTCGKPDRETCGGSHQNPTSSFSCTGPPPATDPRAPAGARPLTAGPGSPSMIDAAIHRHGNRDLQPVELGCTGAVRMDFTAVVRRPQATVD